MSKKINVVKRSITSYYKVWIEVTDPDCLFSIKSFIKYQKVVKSSSINTAIRAAANYCTRYMNAYPGVVFKYITENVIPYNYYERLFVKEED